MKRLLKSYLSKINFELGRNPIVEKTESFRRFIPEPYKAIIIIQADFELAWAWRYSKSSTDSFNLALYKAQLERENVPRILKLCEEFNIPITWATVGHLFLKSCSKTDGLVHPEVKRLSHFENNYWKYDGKDWFEYDPCSDFKKAPEWYCPDLIEEIMNSRIKHEIGCHTFSHIDCRNEVCPHEVFDSEMEIFKKEASLFGLNCKSFVHPGFTIGNLELLKKHGFTSFRSDDANYLGYPVYYGNNLWEIKGTMEFVWRKGWSTKYHIYRYQKIIDKAISSKSLCVFWFHPSLDKRFITDIMPVLFSYIDANKQFLNVTTTTDYIEWLNHPR